MIDPEEVWRTERLIAEPVSASHADEMCRVLGDESLHEFIGGKPLSLEQLRERYSKLAQRRSPDGTQVWCNWVLREVSSGELTGAVQAEFPQAGPSTDVAHVAWEIGLAYQRRGLATEAATSLVNRLHDANWCVVADISPDHVASQRVASSAGLVPTAQVITGETRWWSDPWPGGSELIEPVWDAWHPRDIAARLEGVDVPWAVAAGWALDLFRGEQTREHEDLAIAVPIGQFDAIRSAIGDFEFQVVGSGHAWPIDSAAGGVMVQTWVRERETGAYRLDIFREPHNEDTWICRRNDSIRRPYGDVIRRSTDGVPYVVPEVVLLFKAKQNRDKDHADFLAVLPMLSPDRRAWLAKALSMVHPGHIWLKKLS